MRIETHAIILVGIQVVSVFVSAYNWNKRKWLRKISIPTAIISGLFFILSGHNSNSSPVVVVLASVILGLGFYASVWFQCRSRGESFL